MAHCFAVGVDIDGTEQQVCTTHVPGNETLRQEIESGKTRRPTPDEVDRAVKYYRRSGGNNKAGKDHELRMKTGEGPYP